MDASALLSYPRILCTSVRTAKATVYFNHYSKIEVTDPHT